jgi:C4-dicarboxylate-binding protein DctP
MWEYVDERLQYYTDGEVKLEIFPFGILFSVAEEFDACATGALDMVAMDAEAAAAGGLPDYLINHLPFFFGETAADAFDHDSRFLEHPDGGSKLLAQLESMNIEGLAIIQGTGASLIAGDDEVTSLYDMAGSTARSEGGISSLILKYVDIDEVVVSWWDMPMAFQTGMIDLAITTPEQAFKTKLWETADYGFYYSPIRANKVICMNLELWNGLSPELQDIFISKIVPDAIDWYKKNSAEGTERYLQQLENEGMIIRYQTNEERVELRDGILEMPKTKFYLGQIDPEMLQLANRLR